MLARCPAQDALPSPLHLHLSCLRFPSQFHFFIALTIAVAAAAVAPRDATFLQRSLQYFPFAFSASHYTYRLFILHFFIACAFPPWGVQLLRALLLLHVTHFRGPFRRQRYALFSLLLCLLHFSAFLGFQHFGLCSFCLLNTVLIAFAISTGALCWENCNCLLRRFFSAFSFLQL